MAFFQGIQASDHGNYDEAAKSYGAALKQDPRLSVAREALQELRGLGLITVTKRSREMLQSIRNQTSVTDLPEDMMNCCIF